MKVKHILAIFFFGIIILTTSAVFKIMHWPGASNLLIFGMGIQLFSGIAFILKLIRTKDFKDFMNK